MIDITACGAVGDGATDCTDAIQGALDAAAAAGETVLVPEGRFLVRGLAVPNGVRGIQGVSPASYQNHRTGSVLVLRREGAARALLDLSGCKDLFCRDLALVGFGRGRDLPAASGILVDLPEHGGHNGLGSCLVLDGLCIEDFPLDGIHLQNAGVVTIRHCIVGGAGRRDMALLSRALGRDGEAEAFEREADATARAVRTNFLRPDGLFDESLEKRAPCAETAALALASGFLSQDEAATVLARTPRISHGKFQLLLVRGAFLYGMPDEALRRIREHNWLRLVDPSWAGVHATSECVNFPTNAAWGDEAHPDTALAGELTFGLLGLWPTSPGLATYEARPVPVPGLECSGIVPTVNGPISVETGRPIPQ